MDLQKNAETDRKGNELQSHRSWVKILVIPTNEENKIARETLAVLREIQ
ncbi:MAG: hypothetical protein HQ551_01555 [Desulfobacteraceae bacterium]|nr:hypothetical protein [Desulfobacteraceae bacterium]